MDILERLEIVAAMTADDHPIKTIEFEYRAAAAEIRKLRELVAEAPNYFSPPHDFEGRKLDWLRKAGFAV